MFTECALNVHGIFPECSLQADADLTAKLEKQKAWVEGADIKELSTPAKVRK
jgi:hypothetical protein